MSFLELSTELGIFRVQLLEREAPATCAYFIRAVRGGKLSRGSIFRVVSSSKHMESDAAPIDVVQVGTSAGLDEQRAIIPHEHSAITGLVHDRWSVSAARYRPGELYNSFFICLRREPTLDFGGNRHEDRQGFAAFGKIAEGFEVVMKAHQRVEEETCLTRPIAIDSIRYGAETIDAIA